MSFDIGDNANKLGSVLEMTGAHFVFVTKRLHSGLLARRTLAAIRKELGSIPAAPGVQALALSCMIASRVGKVLLVFCWA